MDEIEWKRIDQIEKYGEVYDDDCRNNWICKMWTREVTILSWECSCGSNNIKENLVESKVMIGKVKVTVLREIMKNKNQI